MTIKRCMREHEVVVAAVSGSGTLELYSHLETCPMCRLTQRLSEALSQLARETAAQVRPTITPRTLWIRAELGRRRQALTSIDRIQLWVPLGFAGLTVVGTGYLERDLLITWMAGLTAKIASSVPFLLLAGFIALAWFLANEVFASDR